MGGGEGLIDELRGVTGVVAVHPLNPKTKTHNIIFPEEMEGDLVFSCRGQEELRKNFAARYTGFVYVFLRGRPRKSRVSHVMAIVVTAWQF